MILVVCAIPVVCPTLVVGPTLVGRHDSSRMNDSDRMPDSDRKIRLRSYIPTPDAFPDSDQHHDSGRISRLLLCITTPVDECVACLTNSSVKDYAWSSKMTATSYNSNT
jgi:hypothetical protein